MRYCNISKNVYGIHISYINSISYTSIQSKKGCVFLCGQKKLVMEKYDIMKE